MVGDGLTATPSLSARSPHPFPLPQAGEGEAHPGDLPMHDLHSRISDGLWQALEARAAASGDPIRHIVAAALAAHLGTEHRTLFQVSTTRALVEGVHEGEGRAGPLRVGR